MKKKVDKYTHTNNVHVVKLGVYCANYSEKVQPEATAKRSKRRKFLPLPARVHTCPNRYVEKLGWETKRN